MTWTTPRTWVAGETVTAALLNVHLRDNLNYLNATPICVIKNSAAQSISNGTLTAMTFDTEDIDTDSMHSTVTNTSRITAVTASWYMVSATVNWATNTSGTRLLQFQTSGTTVSAGMEVTANQAGSRGTTLTASTIVNLAVGDYIEALVYQTSGGALNAGGGAGGSRMTALAVHS